MKTIFNDAFKAFSGLGLGRFHASIVAVLVIAFVLVIAIAVYALIYILLRKLVHRMFRRLERKKGHRIYIEFLERIITFALGVIMIISFIGWKDIGGSLLGSAAVITGIVGFAAQDVIKDILSGLLISIYKPFDLGDRIELEDGTAGIVESITMRHIVVVRIDTLRMVIPNSKINAASILNYSYGPIQRSCVFRFPVAYGSDIEKTKQVIADAVRSSPYSLPDKVQKDGSADYAEVYFIDLSDSAYIMTVTVYYNASTASEKLKDDIYTRVINTLADNHIEIPYNHMSVVIEQEANA